MNDGRRTPDDGPRTTHGRWRIRAVWVVVIVVASGTALGAAGVRSWANRNRVVEGVDYEGVVFNRVHAASVLGSLVSADPNGFWTPTEVDVRDAERALAAAAQDRHPEGLQPLNDYRRQYFGYSLGGARRILMVGFGVSKGLDWTDTFVSAGEGGCHFEADYDVGKDKIISLWAIEGPR
jgi:hypothetical protein